MKTNHSNRCFVPFRCADRECVYFDHLICFRCILYIKFKFENKIKKPISDLKRKKKKNFKCIVVFELLFEQKKKIKAEKKPMKH